MASASDNFDRANGAIGANWTVTSGSYTVASSAANQTTAGGTYRSAIYTATPPATADFYSAASMRSDSSARGAGACVRASSTAVTDYRYLGYGNDAFYLEYLSGGTAATLDTGAACTSSTTYYLRLEASGTAISGSLNGAADVSATHSTLTAGGWGLGTYGQLNSANRLMDTWEAADLGPSGAMSASVPFAFAQSGAATGAGALLGTGTGTFAQVGTLAGLGALTGSEGAVFAQAGTATGAGAIAATAPFVFAEAATLTGRGVLTASVPAIFDQAGTLADGTSPAGALTGALPFAFAEVGTLSGLGLLGGESAPTFAQAGTVIGYGALTVSMAFAFDQLGTLTDGGALSADLAGTIPIAFDQSSTLTGTGALAGAIPFIFTAVYGDNTGIGPVSRYPYLSQTRRTAYGHRDNALAGRRQTAKSEG